MTTELKTAPLAAIATMLNAAIANHSLPIQPVKKFADRASAEKRIAKICEEHGLTVEIVNDELALTQPEVDPTEDTKPSLAEQIAEAAAKRLAAKKIAKPAKVATVGGRRGPAPEFADDAKISLLVETNPKKAGSASAVRFAAYKDGMTVAAALKAGLTRADLRWDVAAKFVKIG